MTCESLGEEHPRQRNSMDGSPEMGACLEGSGESEKVSAAE